MQVHQLPQTQIGPYRLVRKISQGGMGTVYEGVHDAIERRVAIKILHAEFAARPDSITRFFNEARAVNRIDHPGIVQCHDCAQLPDGTPYIVMEFLKGETLSQRARRERRTLKPSTVLRWARQIAAALSAAHQKGIIHRDLKPDNVMLIADPELPGGERVKLLDFGIAKLREPSGVGGSAGTHKSVLMGTPAYMSPEQCRGNADVDEKTDVYALGVMLYRLIAHRLPFKVQGAGELMAGHILQEPTPLAEYVPWLPPPVCAFVHQLLTKDKAQRPSMVEVVSSLDRLIGEFPELSPPTAAPDPSAADGPEIDVDSVDPDQEQDLATRTSGPVLNTPHSLAPRTPHTPYTPYGLQGDSAQLTPRLTTGGMANGEASPPPASRVWVVAAVAGAGALLVSGVVGVLVLRGAQQVNDQTKRAAAAKTEPPAAGATKRVRWQVRTTPAGAGVFRAGDGALLGRTPWTSEPTAGDGTEAVRLSLAGYSDRLVALDRGQDVALDEPLDPVVKPAESSVTKSAADSAPPSRKGHDKRAVVAAPAPAVAATPAPQPAASPPKAPSAGPKVEIEE